MAEIARLPDLGLQSCLITFPPGHRITPIVVS
jgi:hypothetical protein